MPEARIGGAEDLPERVVSALVACRESIGEPPTAKKYQRWRMELSSEDRHRMPSLTAIVPIAYPTWNDAREAAGVGVAETLNISHGPTPKWTIEECSDLLREWLDGGGSGTIAAFTEWIDGQRSGGRDVPSASTIRLRSRMPWSGIVATAKDGSL